MTIILGIHYVASRHVCMYTCIQVIINILTPIEIRQYHFNVTEEVWDKDIHTHIHTHMHTHTYTHTCTHTHIHLHTCILTSWTKAMVRCALAKWAWFEDASIHKKSEQNFQVIQKVLLATLKLTTLYIIQIVIF